MKKSVALIFILITSLSCSSVFSKENSLPTASNVDIGRYIGKWYAVASLPQFFTKKCLGQTAEYQIIGEGKISVLNTCLKANDKIKTIKGQAVVSNTKTNAELIVTFNNFWTKLFRVKGDYTIIKLSEGYDTVLVGSKDRKSLWIMSRTPAIDEAIYSEYVNTAKVNGFPVEKLVQSTF